MKEHEKQTVDAAKEFGASDLTQDLVLIIDSLDKQLTEIIEEGEPVIIYAEHLESAKRDESIIDTTRLHSDRQCYGELNVKYLKVGHIRRLAQALKEVKG